MPTIDVTRTYLEMKARPSERAPSPPAGVRLEPVKRCPWHLYRYLYTEVGRAYHWVDRLSWGEKEYAAYLAGPSTVWLLSVEGAPAGFFDLRDEGEAGVEIALFGLMPEFVGQGLGKFLLARAIDEGWNTGTHRVWLHTCTLDHPSALPNYRKRGFTYVREEVYQTEK